MSNNKSNVLLIKALEDGVNVLFDTPGDSPNPAPERLDKGEVLILAIPDWGHGIRVRGHAEVFTPDHIVKSESGLVIGGKSSNQGEIK